MANSYVITSVSEVGGILTVFGTVNGAPVTVNLNAALVPKSVLASAIGFQAFIGPILLAAAPVTSTAYGTLAVSFAD